METIHVVSLKIDKREKREVIFSSKKAAVEYFNLLKNRMKLYAAYNEVRDNLVECQIFCKIQLQYYKSYIYSSNDVNNINDDIIL